MIKTKKQLHFFLKADLMMNRGTFRRRVIDNLVCFFYPDLIMNFLCILRKTSYYDYKAKNSNSIVYKFFSFLYKYRYHKISVKLGFSIDYNTLNYGTIIPHWGTIVIGSGVKIGKYAVLHTSTCITAGKKIIGDNLYLSTGAKIISDINLGDNVMIGANSVVNKNHESNLLLAGVPASEKAFRGPWWMGGGKKFEDRVNMVESLRKKIGL